MNRRFWLRLLVWAAVAVCAASWGVSGALHYGWARRSLLARVAMSFGRPVEVGHFEFSLLGGPRLEADSVSVSEDPRFGQEYFLRADRLTAGLRWSALLRGKVEFGTLTLTRPSLNLVHMPDGHWNVESWLPPARSATIAGAAGVRDLAGVPPEVGAEFAVAPVVKRLQYIDVDSGRINFKIQTVKTPFALIGVSGHLEQDRSGRWSLDLTATPMRTSVALQNSGTLRLRGTISGTSDRLWPAALTLSWNQASLADAMRLSSGRDLGVRGLVGAEVTATIENASPLQSAKNTKGANARAAQWNIDGTAVFAGIHRWDLAGRATDPLLNVSFAAAWRPADRQLQISRLVLASPRSRLDLTGSADWLNGFHPRAKVVSSHIVFDDLLSWRRAFQTNVTDDLTADGSLGVDASVVDWPPRIEQADIASEGAVVRMTGVPAPLQVGRILAMMKNGTLVIAPISVTLPGISATPAARPGRALSITQPVPPPAGSLLIAGTLGPFRSGVWPRDWQYRIALSGETQRTQDIAAVTQAFLHSESRASAADHTLDQAPSQLPRAGSLKGAARVIGRNSAGSNTLHAAADSQANWTTAWITDWIRNWHVSGPSELQFAWTGALHRGATSASGTLELRGMQISSSVLNQPLVVTAQVDVRPGERRVTIASAGALGAHWRGSLHRRANDEGWTFDLSADHLDAEELDRWMGPRARPSLLARLLPFAARSADAPQSEVTVERLNARGRLRVEEISVSPFRIEKLDTGAELRGRNLVLRGAEAAFYGGRIAGDFEARLSADPAYTFHGQIDRANLGAVTATAGSLAGRVAGFASGELRLTARGVGRDNLLKSLEGDGTLRIREPVLTGLMPADLELASGTPNAADILASDGGRFAATTAIFHVGDAHIRLDPFSLAGRDEQFEVQGNVDFARKLDLRVQSTRGGEPVADGSDVSAHDEWVGGGTLDAPQWTRQTRLAGTRNGAAASRTPR